MTVLVIGGDAMITFKFSGSQRSLNQHLKVHRLRWNALLYGCFMKTLACCLFGVCTGILSGFFGLHFVEEPVKFLIINMPMIACFGVVINLLPSKGV